MDSQYQTLISWLDKLNDSEFEIAVNTLLKPEERNTIPTLNRSNFVANMQIHERFNDLEQYLLKKYPEKFEKKVPPSKHIPFTNQESIIGPIISEYSSNYHILDAPAGYGKTALLHELKYRLDKEFWCVYISTGFDKTITGLIKTLFQEFHFPTPTRLSNTPMSHTELSGVVGELSNLLKNNRPSEKLGIAIFIDLEKVDQSDIGVLTNGLEQLITTLSRGLQSNPVFKQRHDSLRIVIGGRYLTRHEELQLTKNLPFQIHKLNLFSYDVLIQWITSPKSPLNHLPLHEIKHLSAHIMNLSGGHPGAIATLLEKYAEAMLDPDAFLDYHKHDIETLLNTQINQVISDISSQSRNIMNTLSPCRRVTPRFLEEFMTCGLIEGHHDGYALADELTESYLMTYDEGFLHDGVTRGLLAIGLRQTRLEHFICVCQQAAQFYQKELQKPNVSRPVIVAIERLYQELQLAYYQSNHDSRETRQKLADYFFSSILKNCLNDLIASRDERDVMRDLRDAVRKDGEFQFTLNYFLRSDSYNDEPYQKLRNYLEKYTQVLR